MIPAARTAYQNPTAAGFSALAIVLVIILVIVLVVVLTAVLLLLLLLLLRRLVSALFVFSATTSRGPEQGEAREYHEYELRKTPTIE
jgi:uncharacterized membrane protein